MLMRVLKEAELLRIIPRPPVQISLVATFTRLPHVDPYKEAKARQTDIETYSRTLIEIWSEDGKVPGEVIHQLHQLRDEFNALSPGMGDTYISQWMQENAPAVVDKADEMVTDQKKELDDALVG